jgi:chitodextrinase
MGMNFHFVRVLVSISLILISSEAIAEIKRELYVFRAPKNQNGFRTLTARIEVYDVNQNHKLARVIPLTSPAGTPAVQSIRGAMIDSSTRRIYVSHYGSMDPSPSGWLLAMNLISGEPIWHTRYDTEGGRPSLSPDGNLLFLPNGNENQKNWLILKSSAGSAYSPSQLFHNESPYKTLVSLNGSKVFLQSLGKRDQSGQNPSLGHKNGWLSSTNRMIKVYNPLTASSKFVGPFRERLNSFTINGKGTTVFATVDDLIGFQVADVNTGQIKYTSLPPTNSFRQPSIGYNRPFSHGIAITPHEKEAWVPDFKHKGIHAFSITNYNTKAPKWLKFIKTHTGMETNASGAFLYGDKGLAEAPGWAMTSLHNKFVYPETGEIIDIGTKKIVGQLIGPEGLYTHSRFMVEVFWRDGIPLSAGNQVGIGRIVEVTAKPAAPSSFTTTPETTRIHLRWKDVSNESLYNIYRSSGQGNFVFIKSLRTGTTNFTDTLLLPETAYSYRLEAFNAKGKSAPVIKNTETRPDTAAPTAPPKPQASSITDTSLRLTWASSTDNVGVTRYEIQQNGAAIGETTGNTYDVIGLHPNTTYQFRIRAYDQAENGTTGASTAVTTRRSTSPLPPEAPTDLQVITGTTQRIELSWSDNSMNEDHFEIWYSNNAISFWLHKTVGAGVTRYAQTNPSSQVHAYRVRAVNNAGGSKFTNIVTVNLRVPHPPVGLVANTVSDNRIDLAWGSGTIFMEGYELERSLDGTNYTKIADFDSKAYSHVDTGLDPATQYHYRIRSFNQFGRSSYSTPDWAITFAQPVTFPTGSNYTIVSNKTARSVIVVDKQTTLIQQAAKELQSIVQQSTGVTLGIISPNQSTNYPSSWVRFRLGDSTFAAAQGVTSTNLASEHFHIKTVPGNIIIVGRDLTYGGNPGNSPATMWGVLFLMDHYVGARFLWPGPLGTYIPLKDTITLPNLNIVNGPRQFMRSLPARFSSDIGTNTNIVEVMTLEEQNQLVTECNQWLQRQQIGRTRSVNTGHAFDDWWDKYSAEHPDYFAVPPPGVPQLSTNFFRIHLNIGNPAVADQILANYESAGKPNTLFLSPNDGGNYCTSPESMALDLPQNQDPYTVWKGSGNMTTRYVRHWNSILERARALNPDVKIQTLVYGAYKYPPFAQAMPTTNGYTFITVPGYHQPDIWKGWSTTQNEQFLRPNWLHTGVNGPHIPIQRMGSFIKMAQQNNQAGFYYDELGGFWSTQGINYYLIARLFVRPDLGVDEIIAEYASAFGGASNSIRAYLKYWEDYTEELDAPMGSGGTLIQNSFGKWERAAAHEQITGHPLRASWHLIPSLYTDEILDPAYAILAQADTEVPEGSIEKQRVQFLRDGLDQLKQVRETVRVGTLVRFGAEEYREQFNIEDQKLRALRRQLSFKHVVWGNNQYRSEYRRETSTTPYGLTKPMPPPQF